MRISDWSSDVCSSDLEVLERRVFVAPLIGIGQGAVQGLFQIGGEHRGGLLLFQGALQRVLVAARKVNHLGHLGLRHFVSVHAAHADATTLNVQHDPGRLVTIRSEEHKSALRSLMRISYDVYSIKKQNIYTITE